jgi:hypothetical protein
MNDELKLEELTREQILDLADAQGKKLGFLLATGPLNDETKKSILDIIEKSSSEQLDIITKFFEEGYLMVQNRDLDNWLKERLKEIKYKFHDKQEKLDEQTLAKMGELEESIK